MAAAKMLDDDALNALLGVIEQTSRHKQRDRAMIYLGIYAGLRIREICLLEWRMILKPDGKTLDDQITLTNAASKGCSARNIPIHPRLKEALESLPRTGRWVITTERSRDQPASTVAAGNHIKRLATRAGLIGISSHSARKRFATKIALNLGVRTNTTITTLQGLLGHKSAQTTQIYINSATPEQQANLVALL